MKTLSTIRIIYPKDIMKLTRKGERYARAVHRKIREHYGKDPHQLITIDEVCKYFGISPDVFS